MPQIDFEPSTIDFQPEVQIDFQPSSPTEPVDSVAQMASATRSVVGVVGRAVSALDVAQAGADAPESGRFELDQPEESALAPTPGDMAPIAARREAIRPLEASSLLAPMFGRFPRVTAQEVSDALSMLASGSPDLTQEESEAVIEHTTAPGNLEKIVAGAQRAAINIPEAATTPLGVATLGAGVLPATAGRVVSGAFAVDMARHIPEQVGELRAAIASGDSERITEASGNLLATGLMTGTAGKHALTKPKTPLEQVAPLTADAVAATGHAPRETVPATITPLTSAAVEAVKAKEPVPETPAPTPAAATSELGNVPARTGTEPPARVEVAQNERVAKPEGEQALTTEPEIIGMGGAVSSEFAPARQTATGIKNAAVDSERQARGQEPILGPERQATPEVWDRVMAKIDTDPGWQDRLIEEAAISPRALTPEETLALDHRYVDLQNEYAKATRDGAQHYRDGFEQGVQEATERAAFYESKLNELEQVAKTVGTASGRSLQMRKQLINEDFTLAAMEAKARAAKGFEPLTAAEHTEIAALHEKLAAAEKAATEAETVANERIATLEAQKALAEARAAASTAPLYEPRVLAAAEKFASFMDKKGADALSRIKARLGRTSAGIDPTILSDVGILGAAKITRGVVDFAKWTDAMVRDLGEWFRENAREGWDVAQQVFEKENEGFHKGVDRATTPKARRAAADISGRISDAKASIATKAASGEGSPLHSEVRKLTKLIVEQNRAITRDELIDTIHGILKESMPEITRLEAMDAISGRGRFWTPDQSEVAKMVRDLSTQIRLVAHQMDVEAGKPMPRTGYQPDKLTEAASREKKKLNDLMRQYGVVVTDPARQLGAILSALKTRLEREKNELTRRLAEGDFSPRRGPKRELELDTETAAKRAEVEKLRGEFQQQLERHKYEQKTRLEKIWHGIKTARGAFVNIASSFDFSAPRQALIAILANSTRLITSPTRGFGMLSRPFAKMFQAWAKEETAGTIEQKIKARQNAKNGADKMAEIQYSELNTDKFTRYEENAHSVLDEWARLPLKTGNVAKSVATAGPKLLARGVRASNRAFITFLNSTRAELFDELLRVNYQDRAPTPNELKIIGNMVNVATGRGKLGPRTSSVASAVLWAPSLLASRVQALTLQPLWTGKWAESGRARGIVAKEYARAIASGFLLWQVSRMFDDKDETSPTSSDFGKIVRGETRIDMWGGLQQVTTLGARTITATTKSLKGKEADIGAAKKYGQRGIWYVWSDFARSKLRPDVGTAVDILTRTHGPLEEKTTVGHVAENLLVPLPMRSITDILRERGFTEGMIIEALGQFGAGVSNYEDREAQR